MTKKLIISIFVMAFLLMNCEKDPSSSKDENNVPKLNGAFILNEGNFGGSNGSISFYSMEDKKVDNGIFNTINGRPLGDVVQSMTIIDSLGFIVVNNSNKIEVISINTWKCKTTIDLPAGSSPRYLIDVGSGKAYVTNLYTNNVSIINLSTYQIEGSIAVGANPEEIVMLNDKAYVANSGFGSGNTVSVINIASQNVVKEIKVGDNPGSIVVDNNNEIHVLCTGRWGDWNNPDDPGTDGGIYIIDPTVDTVTDSIIITGHPSKLSFDGDETGYYLNGGYVVSYSTTTNKVINDTLIAGFYYGMEVDPISEQIFVLDAKDYAQNGNLKIYDLEGKLTETHSVGLIPGSVTFVYE